MGDSINEYKPDDILIIGENIPHVFRSDPEAYPVSIMYTLFFTTKSFGKEFFNLTDLSAIKKIFLMNRNTA